MGESFLGANESSERLLQALAEQLKAPLFQIARRAELASGTGNSMEALPHIELTADLALKLIDNYLLSMHGNQTALMVEPVSVAAVLHDTAEELAPFAREYNCELELDLAGKYGPVMAHQEKLRAALVSLGHAFIEATQYYGGRRATVTLAAHRGRGGIVTGIFSNTAELSGELFRRAKTLYGRTRQPLQGFTASSAAGVFVADALLEAMDTELKVASHHKALGLAATFLPSRQLKFL